MRLLKTNTAVRIVVGPFLDATDGVTPETALTVTNDTCELFHEHDDGNAPTRAALTLSASGGNNDMVHITDDAGGYYDLELTAANVNFLGRARLSIIDTDVHLPVFEELLVVPANVFDSLVGGSDYLDVNATQAGGQTWTATKAVTSDVLTDGVKVSVGTGAGQINASSGKVPATIAAGDLATDSLTADALKADAATEIANALLKLDLSGVTGESAYSVLNALRHIRNKWSVSGATLTVYKEDGTTPAYTMTVTTNEAAVPITGVTPAA